MNIYYVLLGLGVALVAGVGALLFFWLRQGPEDPVDKIRRELSFQLWVLVGGSVIAFLTLAALTVTAQQAVQQENRSLSTELLKSFNNAEMGEARANLIRYYNFLCNVQPIHQEGYFANFVSNRTYEYFTYYRYHITKNKPNQDLFEEISIIDEKLKEQYVHEIDKSRREIKEFYETVKTLVDNKLVDAVVEESLFRDRFYNNAAPFLKKYWEPAENGQDQAHGGQTGHNREIVEFFEKRQRGTPERHPVCPRDWD